MDKMDNKGVKLEELQGWRQSQGEELQVIKGALFYHAKREIKGDKLMYRSCVLGILIFWGGALKFYIDNRQIVEQGDIEKVLAFVVAIMILILLGVLSIHLFLYTVVTNVGEMYYNAVKNGDFQVLDVNILELRHTESIHLVKVSDLYGNQYERELYYFSWKKYRRSARGILLSISFDLYERNKGKWYYSILKKRIEKEKMHSRQMVIPVGIGNESTWNGCLDFYKKCMKK